MRLAKKIALLLLVILIAIQFIQPARNKSGQVLPTDILRTVPVSPAVRALLKTGCYDCHSNNTNYPWYANVQPIGWILNGHIQKGKAELNFSEFGSYTVRRQKSKMKSIESQVNDNGMPLASYTWIHKNARLSKENKVLIIDWVTKTNEAISTKQ
ncbi:MAG: heme-binding domain-containing protein [Bacteroidota bacterium]